MEFLVALGGLPWARDLRGSVWVYPLVNAVHVIGIGLLLGAIATLDLRILGLWPRAPLPALAQALVPVAAVGLALAALSGAALFSARATEYALSPLFQAKMALLGAALVNIATVHRSHGWRLARGGAPPGVALRLSAALSLLGWLGVVLLGRFVGYF